MAKENDKTHVVDKITNDDTKITISNRSVKWILGIISSAILALGGFAWGLYNKADAKVDKVQTEMMQQMEKNQDEVMDKLEKLEENDVKQNTTKNYEQDKEIGILIDRTNSRSNTINNNAVRPPSMDTVALPPHH